MKAGAAAVVLLLAGLVAAIWLLPDWLRDRAADGARAGYVEGEPLYFAAPVAGPLARLDVAEGERIAAGAPLFAIDHALADAQLHAAEAAAAAASARAADARKGLRAEEIAVIAAQRQAAQAQLDEARSEFERVRQLAARGVLAPARLDQAEAAPQSAEARFQEVARQLDTTRLGAREDVIAAADAEEARARATVHEAQVQRARLSPAAPANGLVEDVFYRPGEWVPANRPVVALLPDDRLRIRFFVPQAERPGIRPGDTVRFVCDGCGPPRPARIVHIGSRAEFTPPVIYSRGSREKLVFLVEAVPEPAAGLGPGQPVDVLPPER